MESEITNFSGLATKIENLEKELELTDNNDENPKDEELVQHVANMKKVIKETQVLIEKKLK